MNELLENNQLNIPNELLCEINLISNNELINHINLYCDNVFQGINNLIRIKCVYIIK